MTHPSDGTLDSEVRRTRAGRWRVDADNVLYFVGTKTRYIPAYDVRRDPRWHKGDDKDKGRSRDDIAHGKEKSDITNRIAYVKAVR